MHACNARKAKLIIAGEGPARRSLEAIAGPTVEFVGYRTDQEVKTLYANARATLFPGEEDFGLVPLESLACGTPVIAFRAGGAMETLTDKTAEFFDVADATSLGNAMERFESKEWKQESCRTRAREFSKQHFVDSINGAIAELMKGATLPA
ncbi:MAG: glycosyltransferase [Candidatus Peribacteraceae bacterium]|nr:glycosyltransferase [Candidatus Peribacteraceae bacterium]